MAINPSLEVDVHPLLRLEELFAVMVGDQNFTKLEFANAYPTDDYEERVQETGNF